MAKDGRSSSHVTSKPLRIGISGTGGIGKTTLAAELSRCLRIPIITEGVREWLHERQLASPANLSRQDQVALQGMFMSRKIEAESALTRFVSDRTVIDGIVISMMRLGTLTCRCRLSQLLEEAWSHAHYAYDLVIIPPLASFALPADEARDSDPFARVWQHRLIIGSWRSLSVPVLSLKSGSLVEWVHRVTDRLAVGLSPGTPRRRPTRR